VAIKFIREEADFDTLFGEITAMRECPHPNILLYLGVVDDADGVYVITEYCSGTTRAKVLLH
jgi:serine/threonine protein kinase